jgi:hypothetical protein
MYLGAKAGQVVYYEREHWLPREEGVLVRYYRDYPDLVKPNRAVISFNGVPVHISVQRVFRKQRES